MAETDLVAVPDKEVDDFLSAINNHYGYDFGGYSRTHVKRRLGQRLRLSGINNLWELRRAALSDPVVMSVILKDLSINVTQMFRDPEVYQVVREQVVPLLKTWSFLRIWHAGCSSGEEVYSMAILLQEEGLYDRVQIYATDFNEDALKRGREGIYSVDSMKVNARNYQRSGARGEFSDYYHARYGSAIMDASLKRNIVWAHHNLVTDSDFAETQMVFCRNVLIYFNPELQNRAYGLFHRSLVNGGALCLGKKESLYLSNYRHHFTELAKGSRIYKKNYDY